MSKHWISASCRGEKCGICYREGKDNPPTHKVGEEFFHDTPRLQDLTKEQWDDPYAETCRHNLTQYLCCYHFGVVMGPLAITWCNATESEAEA